MGQQLRKKEIRRRRHRREKRLKARKSQRMAGLVNASAPVPPTPQS